MIMFVVACACAGVYFLTPVHVQKEVILPSGNLLKHPPFKKQATKPQTSNSLTSDSGWNGVFSSIPIMSMRNACKVIPSRYYEEAEKGAVVNEVLNSRTKHKLFKVMVVAKQWTVMQVHFFREELEMFTNNGYRIMLLEKIKGPKVRDDCRRLLGVDQDPDIIAFYYLEKKMHNLWKYLHLHPAFKFAWLHDLNFARHIEAIYGAQRWIDAFFPTYPETFTDLASPYDYLLPHIRQRPVPECYGIYNGAPEEAFANNVKFSDRKSKMIVSGSNWRQFYPMRERAYQLIASKSPYLELLPVQLVGGRNDTALTQKTYSEHLSHYKMALAGAPPEHYRRPYILMKSYEIPAAGTVMLTDLYLAPYMKREGFLPYRHYIPVTPESLEAVIKIWLRPEKEEELKKIAEAGYQLVARKHRLRNKFTAFLNFVNDLYVKKMRKFRRRIYK